MTYNVSSGTLNTTILYHAPSSRWFKPTVVVQDEGLQDNTYYIFNHVDIVVEFHKKMTDWGAHAPDSAGRLVRAKLTPKRLVVNVDLHFIVSVLYNSASYPWYQMVWQGIQRSSQWENETTRYAVSYCWQTSFIIWSHLSPTGEHTCFAGTATVNRSPHQHSCRCWLEAPAGSSTEKLAAASGRRHWPICWCCLDRGPGSFDVEDATTLSWSSAAVSEWRQSKRAVLL